MPTFCSNVVGVRWKLCSGTKYPSSNPISITRYTPSWNCGHIISLWCEWDENCGTVQSIPPVIPSTSQDTHHHETLATQYHRDVNEMRIVECTKHPSSNPISITRYTPSWNCGHTLTMWRKLDQSCEMTQHITTEILSASHGTAYHGTVTINDKPSKIYNQNSDKILKCPII